MRVPTATRLSGLRSRKAGPPNRVRQQASYTEKKFHVPLDKLCYPDGMTATFEQIREAALHLPKAEQARLLAAVALEMTDASPGVEFPGSQYSSTDK
jgi:hypothetical protein